MKSISDVLFSLYKGSPAHDEWMVACLQGAWPQLIGERLAQTSRPVSYHKGKLVIEVTDEAWEKALRSVKGDILQKVRTVTGGEVQRLSFAASKSGA